MESILSFAVECAMQSGASYADARFQDSQFMTIETEKESVRQIRCIRTAGIGVRILHIGSWHFISTNNEPNKKILRVQIRKALKMTNTRLEGNQIRLADIKAIKAKLQTPCREPATAISLEEKIKLLLTANKSALSSDHRIMNIISKYAEYEGKSELLTCEGTHIQKSESIIGTLLRVTAREGTNLETAINYFGGCGGFELFQEWNIEEKSLNAAKKALALLSAESAPEGRVPVVLDNLMAGTLAHESIGHLVEADLNLQKASILRDKLGQKLTSSEVSIVDDGSRKGGIRVCFDDEGVAKTRTQVIKKGVLLGFLHSRETAAKFDAVPTGNGRAQDFEHRPLVRQTNLCVEPGTHSFEEMVEGVKHGIYMTGVAGGQVFKDGNFLARSEMAYLIENGQLTQRLRGVSILGDSLELLSNIDAVGNDFEISMPFFGSCLKGNQLTWVGSGAPHVRLSEMFVHGSHGRNFEKHA